MSDLYHDDQETAEDVQARTIGNLADHQAEIDRLRAKHAALVDRFERMRLDKLDLRAENEALREAGEGLWEKATAYRVQVKPHKDSEGSGRGEALDEKLARWREVAGEKVSA